MSEQNSTTQQTNNIKERYSEEQSNQNKTNENLKKLLNDNNCNELLQELDNKSSHDKNESKNRKENSKENDFSSFENDNQQTHEEEKNNEEKNVLNHTYLTKKQKLIIEEEAHRLENIKRMQKYYDDLLNNIINSWENNQENFLINFRPLSDQIKAMLQVSCIVSNQDNVTFIFKFLCNYFNYFKDKLKFIPSEVLVILYGFKDFQIFSKNINVNNIFNSNNDLIEDKIFYKAFKEMLPEAEIENPLIPINNNCMYKYFSEFLFHSGFNKNYLTDFLPRKDINFEDYLYFVNYAFSMLVNCSSNFIQKNNYNLLLIRSFTNKINQFLSNSNNLLKQNKNDYLQMIKFLYEKFNHEIFGSIAYMTDIIEKNNLDVDFENFCFSLFKPCEILLKQQKLELRIVAMEHFTFIANTFNIPTKFYFITYNDCEKVLEYTKQKFLKFIKNIDIYELIFGENIHEAIIERSYTLLSFLYKNNSFGTQHVSDLWKLTITKYQTISNSIISLFGKLLPEFSTENCDTILQTVSNMNYNEINEITLKLLENFFKSNQRHENLLNIIYNYSNELNYYKGLSSSIINKSRKILISLLFNKIYANDLHQCIKNCLFCLDNNYLLNTQLTIFIEIIKEFIFKEKAENTKAIFKLINENVDSFQMLVIFLDQKYSMGRILMNNLFFMKKFFIFLIEQSIQLKELINEGNFDFDSLLNIDKLISEFKKFENNNEDTKMDIDNDIKEMNDNNKYNLLPKDSKDIDNYLKIIFKDFIDYFKNKLMKEKISLTKEEITKNILTQFEFSFEKNNYQKVITKIVNNILSIHHMGNIHFKRDLLEFLYKLLVENSIFDGEKEIFYNFIHNILLFQTNNIYLNLLTEKDMEYLYIDKIVSNNVLNLPFAAYDAFNLYMIYINQKYGNIIYSKESKKLINIKDIKLFVGLKTIINFHALSKESKLVANSLLNLSNMMEVAGSDKINRNYILDELFNLLELYKKQLKGDENNTILKTAIRRVLRLISKIINTKVTKNIFDKNDSNNFLELRLINNFYFGNSNEKIPFKIFKGLTIREFKNELIEKVLCKSNYDITVFNNIKNYVHPDIITLDQLKNEIKQHNLIILFCSPTILKDDFTLAEYNIKSGDEIIILNGASTSINSDANFSMTDSQLKEAYSQIKVVFEDKYSEEIMKEALYKHKGDVENTIVFMTVQNNITNLLNEIENNKKNEPNKLEEIDYLEETKFNYLLDILNEGDSYINGAIWSLFAEMKFQDDLIMNSIGVNFDKFFEEKNLNKKILILKIINSVIFGNANFCKYNKLNKKIKNEWITKFIKNENFISTILRKLSEIIINESNEIDYSEIIQIIINWFLNIINKIKDINKNIINLTEEESDSNFNILEENKIEQKQKKISNSNIIKETNSNNNKEKDYGEYEIDEIESNNFIKILEDNKFIVMIYNILNVVAHFSLPQTKVEKKKTIKNIYDIIIEYIDIKPKNVFSFLEEEKNKRNLVIILISSKEKEIRKSTLDFFKNLLDKIKDKNNNANIKPEDKIDIQSKLLSYYYKELISEEVYYQEFYELYNYLINIETVKQDIIPIDKMIEKLLDYIYNFYTTFKKINEDNAKDQENLDKIYNKLTYNIYILNCFYPFYEQILKKEVEKKYSENKDLITLLYNSIFNFEKNLSNLLSNEQLCLNEFNFLSILINLKKDYFNLVNEKIINQHKTIPKKILGFPVDYPLRNFEKNKFIGLKNFGATCYLNSLLQQMYMIPTFKQDLLKFNINSDKLEESTIYNMQLAFINLKQSILHFYPPMPFIKSFKEAFNGEPIHVGIQQDTDEFLAILCDKLEEEAKKYNKQDFLENSFKGGISNEILSLEKDYKYYSQITEPFYRITLDIKGNKTLEEALDAYVKGEILDGENKYYCSNYNKKISVKKRSSIKFMGNEIIIHLKRFEFDFITFQNNKLNDYLQFPLELNLKKWTRAYIRINELEKELGKNNFNYNDVISEREKENFENEKMDFELTGILVHSGTNLQNGHYYSIIKDQDGNKWYKFNDNNINEFDIEKDLEKECFGNKESKKNEFGRGAYLLFYTRKECIKKNKNLENNLVISEKLVNEIKQENIKSYNLKLYNSIDYHKFVLKFVQIALNYFNDENVIEIHDEENEVINSYDKLMNIDMLREIKIYQKILELLKGNKENNIDINEQEIKVIPTNIEEIYEKCKTEIIYNEENKIKPEKKKIISLKHIVKFLYTYTFGIIYQYDSKDIKLKECLNLLKEILEKNSDFALMIMKLMEKNINIFIDLLFKFGYSDKEMQGINKTILELYQTLFTSLENYEKEKYEYITQETFFYFIKDENGNCKFEKEYKSLYLRMVKKLLCDSLEKCRKEYLRDKLFLNVFYWVINITSDTSIVASNYLLSLVSFITNNTVPNFKSVVNPNIIMGNNANNFKPNELYLDIFCKIILKCVTPGMLHSKKKSPYFETDINLPKENIDFQHCPKLPQNWTIILDTYMFLNFIFLSQNSDISRIICHICFEDPIISSKVIDNIKICMKTEMFYRPRLEEYVLKGFEIFSLDDGFNKIRLDSLFEFDKEENGQETLIKFWFENRFKTPKFTLKGLYILTQIMERYNIIFKYVEEHIDKLKWINEYYAEIIVGMEEKNNFYNEIKQYLDESPLLVEYIKREFIIKLDK